MEDNDEKEGDENKIFLEDKDLVEKVKAEEHEDEETEQRRNTSSSRRWIDRRIRAQETMRKVRPRKGNKRKREKTEVGHNE